MNWEFIAIVVPSACKRKVMEREDQAVPLLMIQGIIILYYILLEEDYIFIL